MGGKEEYLRFLKERQRLFRKKPTLAESKFKLILKKALEELGLNARVSFQYLFNDIRSTRKSYILDFFMPYLCLAFEIDGSSHNRKWQKTYDLFKSQALAQQHILIARITNQETENFVACKEKVKKIILKRKRTRKLRGKIRKMKRKRNLCKPVTAKQLEYLKREYFRNGGKITIVPNSGLNRKFENTIKQYVP